MRYVFTKADEGKQLICITVADESKTGNIIRELESRIPDISKALFTTTDNELVLDLDCHLDYGMGLKELSRLVKTIDEKATIRYIVIDFKAAPKTGRHTILKH